MNVHIVLCFIFLALKKNFSRGQPVLFRLVDSHLTATEGSCAEIKCRVTNPVNDLDAYWFWMKDAVWKDNFYNASIIYSTNISLRPIRPDFVTRVKYTGSPPSDWISTRAVSKLCSILICNLTKGDSGNYSFRFLGSDKWVTKPDLYLNVTENPCPITFEKPPVVNESTTITLNCSTLSSCPSNLKITGLTPLSPRRQQISVSFNASWKDDGKELSCQTQDNKDIYLNRTINLTVEYAPKDTQAEISPPDIVEGKTVTLTCSAKGNPLPTFTWFKNKSMSSELAQWVIPSISASQSGTYYCRAQNKHGTNESQPLVIDVKYFPQVEIKTISSPLNIEEGYTMFLTCEVRSNPEPCNYTWFKNEKTIGEGKLYNKTIEPDDGGSYSCQAINTVGPGKSQPILISVKYGPRRTNISSSVNVSGVKAGYRLTLSCNTDANPAPMTYSWYRYSNNKLIEPSQWKSKTTNDSKLSFEHVQRTDEACYMCNATNIIRIGENSRPVCITVQYAPTNLMLFMESEVKEGQLINITCTVESFPWSTLELRRTSKQNPLTSKWHFGVQQHNTLCYIDKATSDHTGFYSCTARNTEGSNTTAQKKLTVKYSPKNVIIQAQPGLTVNENASLTLHCVAQSHPAVISFTWTKMTDRKREIIHANQTMRMNSVGPSDSGWYLCSARNEMGTGNSQQVEVKVKYGPKLTQITRAAEQQHPKGSSSVKLSCDSHSFPPVNYYTWYKKTQKGDIRVSSSKTYTVYSNEPGMYYCIAKNEISDRFSDPVELFVERDFMRALKFIFLVLFIFLFIFLLSFIYRRRRNKAVCQNTNVPCCFAFQSRRRHATNGSNEPKPSRSRDDLLPDQPCHPKAQWRQPQPGSTPASNINSVCSTVDLPAAEGPSAQKPTRQKCGQTEDECIKYAALHFGHKQKWNIKAKAEENIVYARVLMQKPPENEQGLEVYENITAAQVANTPNQWNDDTDTSEDEVDVGYTQVSFTPKPGHQRAGKNSGISEEETLYSDIKV